MSSVEKKSILGQVEAECGDPQTAPSLLIAIDTMNERDEVERCENDGAIDSPKHALTFTRFDHINGPHTHILKTPELAPYAIKSSHDTSLKSNSNMAPGPPTTTNSLTKLTFDGRLNPIDTQPNTIATFTSSPYLNDADVDQVTHRKAEFNNVRNQLDYISIGQSDGDELVCPVIRRRRERSSSACIEDSDDETDEAITPCTESAKQERSKKLLVKQQLQRLQHFWNDRFIGAGASTTTNSPPHHQLSIISNSISARRQVKYDLHFRS